MSRYVEIRVVGICSMPLLIHSQSPYAVSNIPASAYVQATSPWASSDAYIQHTMYPLVEGEWAAIVFQNRFQDENIFSRHWRDQFHISFLTLKNGNMHILRVEEFLKETSCEDFEPAWGRNVAEIKSSALEKGNVVEVVDCSEELVGNIMAVMDMVKKGDLEM
ncbi:hypothetical protein DM02DRAFT_165832 [Periconia macrospinosa]|uniref:Uncharacterized protein n=1 Tax=Periconia macrospinosa TaxID=97972 RepID=A0A2V1DAP9_9PLEO|nr:hypothetical protein DM02DRAFT_165832 [Periconia macrospinosa]